MATQKLEVAGYRCMECGRLDPWSDLPCTEHGDVEKVYRLVDDETGRRTRGAVPEPEAEWRTDCVTCGRRKHFILHPNAKVDIALHRQEFPGHDIRAFSIPLA